MWNMAVNNISYPIYMYPLSTRIEKGYTTKIIPFFFSVLLNSFVDNFRYKFSLILYNSDRKLCNFITMLNFTLK